MMPASKQSAATQQPAASERGYTMQTVIITAILVLGAVISSVLLYAILTDTSKSIASGSDSFSGQSSGPQNLQLDVQSNIQGGVDIEVSWDAPSYLGTAKFKGYELTIRGSENETPVSADDAGVDCDAGLDAIDENDADIADFSYSNACRWNNYTAIADSDYQLLFSVVRENSEDSENDLRERFIYPLDLNNAGSLNDVQVTGTDRAIVVSWKGQFPNTFYRFRINSAASDDPSEDYSLCVTPTPDEAIPPYSYTQELPNVSNLHGIEQDDESNADTLRPGAVYTIEMSYVTPEPPNFDCTGDFDMFDRTLTFQGSFGQPATPQFTVESVTAGELTLPQVTVTSPPCHNLSDPLSEAANADTRFTFHWTSTATPDTVRQASFEGCRMTLPVNTLSSANARYQIWGIARNSFGASQTSAATDWFATPESEQPRPPANPRVLWTLTPPDSTNNRYSYDATLTWQPTAATGDSSYQVRTYLEPPGTLSATTNIYSFQELSGEAVDCPDELSRVSRTASRATSLAVPTITATAPTSFLPRSVVLCAEITALTENQDTSPPATLKSQAPQVALSYANAEGDKVTVSWRHENPQDIAYYTAALAKTKNCPALRTLMVKTVMPDPADPDSTMSIVLPLTSLENPVSGAFPLDDFICLTTHYNDGTTHTFYNSAPLTALPRSVSSGFVAADPPPTPGGVLTVTLDHHLRHSGSAATFSAIPFYVCVYWRVQNSMDTHSESVLGNQSMAFHRGATQPGATQPNIYVAGSPFTWDMIFWEADGSPALANDASMIDTTKLYNIAGLDVATSAKTSGVPYSCPNETLVP